MSDKPELTQEFTIDRDVWLRGEGGDTSKLLRWDGQRCCIGIYLQSLGLEDHVLRGEAQPVDVGAYAIPPEGCWLLDIDEDDDEDAREFDSLLADKLIIANDRNGISESEREAEIAGLFAAAGVRVTFTGPMRDEP